MIYFFSVGNPGPANRHSVGHKVLQHLIHSSRAPQLVKKGTYSITSLADASITFVRSNIYMNDSGRLFASFVSQERVNFNSDVVLILYDDFDHKLGSAKVSLGSSSASHNGIKSIKKHMPSMLQIPSIFKVAIGVGPKPTTTSRDTIASWVLSPFSVDQLLVLNEATMVKMDTLLDYVCVDDIDDINLTQLNKLLK